MAKPKQKKYLLVKGGHGFGNRILALLGALVYARHSGREILVDWSDPCYSSDGRNVFPLFFHSSDVDAGTKIPISDSVTPPIWKNNLCESADEMMWRHHIKLANRDTTLSIDPGKLYQEEVAVMYLPCFFYGKLKKQISLMPNVPTPFTYDSACKHLLKTHLFFSRNLLEIVEEHYRKNFKTLTIGVHIRQTDNMTPDMKRRKGVSTNHYFQAIEKILRDNPRAKLFVSTDSSKVLAILQSKYPTVPSVNKWFSSQEQAGLHLDKTCPDKRRMGTEALVEMLLLAECDWFVYNARSSFGQIAAWLSKAENRKIKDVSSGWDSFFRTTKRQLTDLFRSW